LPFDVEELRAVLLGGFDGSGRAVPPGDVVDVEIIEL
jgi:hypothetical protein